MRINRISVSSIRLGISLTIALSMTIGIVYLIYRIESLPASTSQLHELSYCAKNAALGLPTSQVITGEELRKLEENCQNPLASALVQREVIQNALQ